MISVLGPPARRAARSLILGTPIESWISKLTRPPGAGFFCSAPNQVVLLVLTLALFLIWRWRRRVQEVRQGTLRLAMVLVLSSWGAGLGSFLAAGGARGFWEDAYVVCWECSMAAILATALLALPIRRERRVRRADLAATLGIALLASLWGLERNPPRIHAEEVSMGEWSRYCLEGRLPELFTTGYFDNPILHFTIDALLMKYVGDGLWGLRFTSVLVGLLTTLVVYLLAGELWPGRLAPLLAALVTSFHHAVLYYGRNGLHIIDAALAVTATAYFAVRGLKALHENKEGRNAWANALLAGAVAGVASQGYFPTRMAPVVAIGLMALHLLFPAGARRREVLRSLAASLIGLVVALGPLLVHFVSRPGTMSSREQNVLAFDPAGLVRGEAEASSKLVRNLRMTLRLHTVDADTDPHYGGTLPFLHPLLLPLVAIGLIRALLRPRDLDARLCILWVSCTLVLGSIIVKEPRIRRTIGVIPADALLLVMGTQALAAWSGWPRLVMGGATLLAGAAAADQADYVLRRYPLERPVDLPSATARYLAIHRTERVQLMTLPDIADSNRYLTLFAPSAKPRRVESGASLQPGPLVVSAVHASLLPAIEALPGVRVERPWGSSPDWKAEGSLPEEDPTRLAPPLLAVLTRPIETRVARVTLWSVTGRLISSFDTALLFFDYRKLDLPGLGRVTFTMSAQGSRDGIIRIQALSRQSPASFALDGRRVPIDQDVRLGPGPHRMKIAFVTAGKADSLQLVVTTGGGASCCTSAATIEAANDDERPDL